jgi:hypothetical protein
MIAVAPTEKSDERALGRRARLRLADVTVELTSVDLDLKVTGLMNKFLVEADDAAAEVSINTTWGEMNEGTEGRLLFDSGSHWQLYEVESGYQFRLAGPMSGWRPYKLARFNRDFTSGEILCSRDYYGEDEPLYTLEYPLDEVLFMHLLAKGRGVELHSCGLVDEQNNGYLFVGQSGAGKTTTARLWQQHGGVGGSVKILSDDRIILRRVDGRVWMYGTPWHGEAELGAQGKVPLKGIFLLGRGERNELVEMSRVAAAAELLACAFPPFHSPEGLEFTLSFLEKLTETVPCRELRFVPDESVVEFLREQSR